MAKKAALAIAMAILTILAFAQGDKGGLIEGEGWAFLVSAPEGWVRDGATLRAQGIRALFYRAGSVYSPSGLHIYISPVPKKPGGPASLSEFLEADEAAFMKSDPGSSIADRGPYNPGLGYSFVLKDFEDRNEGFFQALAYYDGLQAYFIFVLSCRDAQERERERPAFLELLDSFTYIAKE
jgi:hypothetical protein